MKLLRVPSIPAACYILTCYWGSKSAFLLLFKVTAVVAVMFAAPISVGAPIPLPFMGRLSFLWFDEYLVLLLDKMGIKLALVSIAGIYLREL